MKKRLLCAGLTTLLALGAAFGAPMTAQAQEYQGEEDWEVVFDGKKISNNFSNADMDDEIYNIQPGDSVELTVTLKNKRDGKTNWYMRNKVLETLEETAGSGGAYDYLLTYTDAAGETSTLYSSEKFGGEGRIGGVGLHGATKTLENYFFLEQMDGGASGVVKLKVALDGETLVNDYQNTLARLQMDFATEAVSTTTGRTARSVRTGDEANTLLWIVLMLAAGLVILIFALFRFKREREEAASMASMRDDRAGRNGRAGKDVRRRNSGRRPR
ncbi:MAG: hypothetical protein HFG41_02695 [Coprococcus sp.]|nr:hypothetical protein [Coprococcus sp.]